MFQMHNIHSQSQLQTPCAADPKTASNRSRSHTRQAARMVPHTRHRDLHQEGAHSHTREALGVALLGSLLLLLLLGGPLGPVHAAAWCVAHCRVLAVLQASRPALLSLTTLPRCVRAPSPTLQKQRQRTKAALQITGHPVYAAWQRRACGNIHAAPPCSSRCTLLLEAHMCVSHLSTAQQSCPNPLHHNPLAGAHLW